MDYVYLLFASLAVVAILHVINTWLKQPAKHKPAIMSQKPQVELTEANHLAFIKLGSLLSSNQPNVKQELERFVNDKPAYFSQFAEDLDNRGILQENEIEPVIALIDALKRVNKLGYHDWKADPLDVLEDLNALSNNTLEVSASYPELLTIFEKTDYGIYKFLDEPEQESKASLFTCVKEQGLRLLIIDEGSDAYALALVPDSDLPDIMASAKGAHINIIVTDA